MRQLARSWWRWSCWGQVKRRERPGGRRLARPAQFFLNPGTVLKVGKRVVDDPEQQARASGGRRALLRVYRVDRQSGPWLWLVPERRGPRVGQGRPGGAPRPGHPLPDGGNPPHPRDLLAYLRQGILRQDQPTTPRRRRLQRGGPARPEECGGLRPRGRARQWAGDLDGAINDYDTALRLDPEDAVAFSYRGHIWQLKGNLDRAIADFDAVIGLDPQDPAASNNRARFAPPAPMPGIATDPRPSPRPPAPAR